MPIIEVAPAKMNGSYSNLYWSETIQKSGEDAFGWTTFWATLSQQDGCVILFDEQGNIL